VVGIFPNENAIVRFVRALLLAPSVITIAAPFSALPERRDRTALYCGNLRGAN